MIVLFPMLTSKSISPIAIPGICKALEKFVLVYKMDDVLNAAGIASATIGAAKAMAVGSLFRKSESENLTEAANWDATRYDQAIQRAQTRAATAKTYIDMEKAELEMDKLRRELDAKQDEMNTEWNPEEGSKEWYEKQKAETQIGELRKKIQKTDYDMKAKNKELAITMSRSELEKDKNEVAKKKAQIDALSDLQQDFKIDVAFPQAQNLSIEPTWVTLSTRRGAIILGIKVVAFPIDSDSTMIKLMSSDLARNGIDQSIEQFRRRIARALYGIARGFKLPFIGKDVISDDPVDAILFARTQHGRNIFVCLNYSDVNNNRMLLNAMNVSKLFKMGWTSFVTADDVNKRAVFCMNEFKGMCSIVPYSYLHAAVSRDAGQAYNDLDDIKSSASPFFRLSVPRKKIVSEGLAYQKLKSYMGAINGDE